MERPAELDFSVFRRLRGVWEEGMHIARDELHESVADSMSERA